MHNEESFRVACASSYPRCEGRCKVDGVRRGCVVMVSGCLMMMKFRFRSERVGSLWFR